MREIPPPMKRALRPMWRMVRPVLYKLVDLFDSIRGGRNPLVPPRSMIFVGDGDYEKAGNEFFVYFREFGKLKPSDKVLDVGCGIGRMSLPLTTYLAGGGNTTVLTL